MNFQTMVCSNILTAQFTAIHTDDPTVVLSLLPNLRRIYWECAYSRIFQIVATQFCSIRTPCKLVQVILCLYHDGYEGIKDHCKAIDEALSSDNFPSLRSVQLHGKIPFDYFPALQSRKLLSVCY